MEKPVFQGLIGLVTFLAPASATATSLVPYFRIPSRNITVTFPLAFKYRTPPDILLVSFTPTTAA